MTKIEVTVKRPAGNIEIVDISKMFGSMDLTRFNKLKKDTAAAKKGLLLKVEYSHMACNMMDLVKSYNNINNEGGEGYVPDPDYFKALPNYVETTVTEIFE